MSPTFQCFLNRNQAVVVAVAAKSVSFPQFLLNGSDDLIELIPLPSI